LFNLTKKNGDFTYQQKIDNFIKPNKDILDMITKSIDFNFRKACLNAIIDYNTNLADYKEFFKQSIVKETLKSMTIKSDND
jgi:phage tail protein X